MRSSYGSVFKAIHKESGQVVAIKQVPVESDLQEIIKEISIMQQCDRFRHYTNNLFMLQNSGLHHQTDALATTLFLTPLCWFLFVALML